MSPADVLTYGAVVIALIFGARGTVLRTTLSALKEQNDAFARREAQRQLDKERDDQERAAEKARTEAALKRLGDRNEYLEELVLHADGLGKLGELMAKHDEDAARRHADTFKMLRSINRHLDEQAHRREEEPRP